MSLMLPLLAEFRMDGNGILVSLVLGVLVIAMVMVGGRGVVELFHWQRRQYSYAFGGLMIEFPALAATIMTVFFVLLFATAVWAATGSVFGGFVGVLVGAYLPVQLLAYLRKRRLSKLEGQLVTGIQTLGSAVRAGLNLVQAMQLIARDGAIPMKQEFAHLLREYEYGMGLEEAMEKASGRIGSGDYRLLFSALQTHRERGGDLGETLDRIADSIREIQRLEARIKTLTAQGRANARMLSALVPVTMGILYMMNPEGVQSLFIDDIGRLVLFLIVVLTVTSFLWIKKIIAIDI